MQQNISPEHKWIPQRTTKQRIRLTTGYKGINNLQLNLPKVAFHDKEPIKKRFKGSHQFILAFTPRLLKFFQLNASKQPKNEKTSPHQKHPRHTLPREKPPKQQEITTYPSSRLKIIKTQQQRIEWIGLNLSVQKRNHPEYLRANNWSNEWQEKDLVSAIRNEES